MLLSLRATRLGAIALALVASTASADPSVSLVKGGESRHQIVLQEGASPSEKFAAKELQDHVKACAGVELPIVEGSPDKDRPMIVLGCGGVAKALGVDPKPEQLGQQGFVLKTAPPHIVIAGTRDVGTLYGVHRFLENYLGVRWYTQGVTKTPRLEDLTIPSVDRLIKPAFLMRDTSYHWAHGTPEFRARQADNRNGQRAGHPQGIGYAFRGTCHSYFSYIRPEEFFKTHPEYFSEIGGVRVGTETQLCLTNPEVLEIVAQRMLKRMKDEPHHDQYNFSQMDYYKYCECARCRAMNERYGTLGGTQFWFVNELAKRTSKVCPDKLIGTLAYMYTEEPPRGMTMHPNVAVWLCHMFPSCDSHPIATCPLNADYKRRAEAWSKICSHLYAWHYIVDFAHYYNPFPNLRAMAADLKFYRDLRFEGIYLQAMGPKGGEFGNLRGYLGMKLLWDPDQDAGVIIKDFLQGYYGAAWEPIWQYITMLHDKVEKENIHMHLYTNPAQGYLTDDVVKRAGALFDQAEAKVADDAELLERVRVCRMPVTYARTFPRNGYSIEGDRLAWLGDIASQKEIVTFLHRMDQHGFGAIREMYGDPKQLLQLGALLNTRLAVATIRNEHLSVDVVPMLAGRALRIIDGKTGACVTAHNVVRNLMFPFAGGVETRIGETFRFYGWIEPGVVTKQTDSSVTVRLKTTDDWQLERTVALAPDRPIVEIITSATNPDKKPREIRLRGHMELDLGELRKTRVRFTDRAGQKIDKDMTAIVAGLREGEHYHDQHAPAGSWTLVGTKGLALTHTFDTKGLDFTWLYAYPESLGQLDLEVWLKRKVVEPGERLAFRQTLEIRPAN